MEDVLKMVYELLVVFRWSYLSTLDKIYLFVPDNDPLQVVESNVSFFLTNHASAVVEGRWKICFRYEYTAIAVHSHRVSLHFSFRKVPYHSLRRDYKAAFNAALTPSGSRAS
jgi:hypothetical protein